MKCEFCHKDFGNSSSLNRHQKTARYCLKLRNAKPSESLTFICPDCGLVSTQKTDHEKHIRSCKRTLRETGKDKLEQEIVELKNRNDELVKQLVEKEKQFVKQLAEKDLQFSEKMAEKNEKLAALEASIVIYKEMTERDHRDIVSLADRPTTTNTNTTNNFNCPPLTQEHFDENAQFLSLDHIKKGFQGYAQYALDYPLKGRVKCTDYARRKVKFKNEDGEVVVDPEMKQVRTRLFSALRSRNQELTAEYVAELKQKAESGEWNRTDVQDLMLEAINLNGEVLEVGQGNNSESIPEFVKWVCTGLIGSD